jgi:hypothetical protein
MTAPSRARTTDPVLYGAPPGRKYVDELPPCALLRKLYGDDVAAGVFEAPSVTTIVKGGSPTSWALRKWDREEVGRYAVRQARVWSQLTRPDGTFDEEAAIALISEAPFRSLGRASSRGTDIHKVLELKAKGLPVPDEAVNPSDIGWKRAVDRFFLEHAPVPVWVEVSVYSRNPHQPYAGTLDLICWLRTGPIGEWELWLVDLKTGKGVYGDMALQQAAYRYAHYGLVTETPDSPVWRREPLPRVQRMGILNAHDDGSYDLVELHDVDSEGVPATEHFSSAYERWEQSKAERSLVGPRIPVPGRLEVELAGSLLLERLKRLPADWQAWLAGAWPSDVPRPGPVVRGESSWTASHVEAVEKLLAKVEAELQLPLEVLPRMEPAELPPHVDAFAGLPDMAQPDPLVVAAEHARSNAGPPANVDPETGEVQRTPEQEAHFQAQLARLAAGGVGAAPEVPRNDEGLTERQLEQWHSWLGTVLEAEQRLPLDLFRDLEGWAASEHLGNVRTFRPSVETFRKLELLVGQYSQRLRAAEDRAGKVLATLEAHFPPTDPETLDGKPDPQRGMWGHLIAIAATKDDSLVDTWAKDGGDFYDYADSIPRLAAVEATIVRALATELGQLTLCLSPDGENTSRLRVAVVEEAMGKALEELGLGARELTRAAKEVAIKFGLPHRPSKAADVRDSPILASLLLAPHRSN